MKVPVGYTSDTSVSGNISKDIHLKFMDDSCSPLDNHYDAIVLNAKYGRYVMKMNMM